MVTREGENRLRKLTGRAEVVCRSAQQRVRASMVLAAVHCALRTGRVTMTCSQITTVLHCGNDCCWLQRQWTELGWLTLQDCDDGQWTVLCSSQCLVLVADRFSVGALGLRCTKVCTYTGGSVTGTARRRLARAGEWRHQRWGGEETNSVFREMALRWRQLLV